MSLNAVESALLPAIGTVLNGWSIEYENKSSGAKPAPKPGNKWASVFFLPNTPGLEGRNTLGDGGSDFATGLVQVDLNYAPNGGNGEARTDFEAIRAAFKKGSTQTYGGQTVTIDSTGRQPGREVDGWYRVSVNIYWYALIPR